MPRESSGSLGRTTRRSSTASTTPGGRNTRRMSMPSTSSGGINPEVARRAFQQLQERERDRADKRARHHRDPLPSSDDENDSPHPVLDTFRETIGTVGVLRMTNFTPSEIVRLYGFVSDYMSTRWNVDRGRRCAITAIDVFFMTLSVLKNGADWAVLVHSFSLKSAAFKKMIVRFLEMLSPRMYALYVEDAAITDSYKKLMTSGHAFEHYPAARYAVNVTFQQSAITSGSQEERVVFYSAKHKLHGYKT